MAVLIQQKLLCVCPCQAQARCHRIGQSKAVKVYRLITRNSYEREMFDKASLKLGLDKAVLQDINRKGSLNGVRDCAITAWSQICLCCLANTYCHSSSCQHKLI